MEKIKNTIKKHKMVFIFIILLIGIIGFNISQHELTKEGLVMALEDSVSAIDILDKIFFFLILVLAVTLLIREILPFLKSVVYEKYGIEDEIDFEYTAELYQDIPNSKKEFKFLLMLMLLTFIIYIITFMKGEFKATHIQGFFTYLFVIMLLFEEMLISRIEFLKELLDMNEEEIEGFKEYVNNNEEIKSKRKILKYAEESKDKEKMIKTTNILSKICYILTAISVIVILFSVVALIKSF